jgi:ABC-2 type transport system permease protein
MRAFRLAAFHGRQLLRVPFFVHQAFTAPLVFEWLRAIGLEGSGTAIRGDLWLLSGVAGMWSTTTLAVGIIGFQRFQGTLEHLAMSVLRPGTVFGALAVSATLIGLPGFPLAFAAQALTSGHPVLRWSDVLVVAGASIACAASSSVLAALFVLFRSATVLEPLVLTPVWLVTGVVLPLTALPGWLVPVALAHPLTSTVLAVERPSNAAVALPVAASVVVSAGWFAVAALAMHLALRRVRITGTLGLS